MKEGSTCLSYCPRVGDRNPFHRGNSYVLATKPDFKSLHPPLTFSGKEWLGWWNLWDSPLQILAGPRVLAKSWSWVWSSVSLGRQAQSPGSSEAARTKDIPRSSRSSACQQNPTSPRRNHRVGLQYSNDRAAKTQRKASLLLRTPPTLSPPKPDGEGHRMWQIITLQNSHPGAYLTERGSWILGPRSNRPFWTRSCDLLC